MNSRTAVFISFILCLFLVGGCSTAYQREGFKGGYSDLLLDSNTFRVSFRGNGYTSSDTVETYLLYRCAELTVQRGFDYFVIVDTKGETKQSFYTSPGSYSSSTSFSGNTAYTSGTYSPGTTIPIHKHRATVIMKVFKGSKPDLPGAYTAKELMDNLRAQVPGLSEVRAGE